MFSEVYNMKIKWLEYEDLDTGLKIEHIDFFDDLTLLVGLSGVGKTEIIKAINYATALLQQHTFYDHQCSVKLGIYSNGHLFTWSFTYERSEEDTDLKSNYLWNYVFTNEELKCDNKLIFKRDSKDNIEFVGYTNFPKPRKDQSLLYQYKDDPKISSLFQDLDKCYCLTIESDVYFKLTRKIGVHYLEKINSLCIEGKDNEDIVPFDTFSYLSPLVKLYALKRYYPGKYETILSSISDIFNEIIDIDMVMDEYRDCYAFQITIASPNAKNGKKMLMQNNISNGMLKSIAFIIELYTTPKNSLIAIDEFENGLGMNCIGALADLIQCERPDLQFIITSHHPKVIGSIDYSQWKIIEREDNVVQNYLGNDERYDLGGNRHDAYFNLLQHWDFEGKI